MVAYKPPLGPNHVVKRERRVGWNLN